MALDRKLMIVVDPTLDTQPAVDRVTQLAALGNDNYRPDVTLVVTADLSAKETEIPGIYLDREMITQLTDKFRAVGITPDVVVSWSKDWADNLLYTAGQVGATSILLSHPGAERAKSMTDDFWHLVRNTSVPVGIYQNTDKPKFETILASIDIQDQSEERSILNRKIGDAGKSLAKTYGAQFHIANAYGSSSNYPDRGRMVALTGIPNENIHLAAGEPEEGIAEITRKLDPDVIIIGATHRRGIKAALRGRKISRIFESVDKDIFIIV